MIHLFEQEEFQYTDTGKIVCGVDEAGRGPIAGPLSIALVQFNKKTLDLIFQRKILIGLNDSKKLSEKIRESLFDEIQKYAEIISHQFISSYFIDAKGLAYSIYYGIRKLYNKSNLINSILLIDGNYNFSKYETTDYYFNYKSIIKGDSRVASIAAASIIAKVKRDRYMKKLSDKFSAYNFKQNKGYGTKHHLEKIKEFGYSKVHRKSFFIKQLN